MYFTMKLFNLSYFLLFFLPFCVNAQEVESTAEKIDEVQAYYQYADSVETAMKWETAGTTVAIGDGKVDLVVPEGFKFLNPEQGKFILKEVYGNPNGENLGILYPESSGIWEDSSYFVVFSYDDSGYITDEDAQDMDYEELMEGMKEDMKAVNEERKEHGYGSMEILGWASEPYYDASTNKLHWAKSILFEGNEEPILNYNLLALGRNGYLKMNFVADMNQLENVKSVIPSLMPSVNFNDGYKYAQFDSSIDKVAAYGIGGLIAGKVLAKVGFFAFLAKFGKVIVMAIIGVVGAFWKKIKGKKAE